MKELPPMSHWNHRVMKHPDGTLGIHEVYYDKDGKPQDWEEFPSVMGETKKEMTDDLKHMEKCMKEPTLDYKTGEEIEDNAKTT